MFHRSVIAFAAWLVILAAVETAWPQESRGSIIGRVTDSSESVVPAASVRVTNIATGVSVPTATNENGNYSAPFMIPGTYRVTVEKSGFKRSVRDGLELRVNDRLEVNISLELGEVVQTVNVTAESLLLDTASASVGQVVDPRLVSELPIAHGNPYHLIRLSAGMSIPNVGVNRLKLDAPWALQFSTAYAAAGSDAYQSEFTMDGASNTNTELGKNQVSAAYMPPADVVAEFKVQTAVFDATMGQSAGSIVNVSVKSGTNTLHGTAYYARLDPSWNANQFFANRASQPPTTFDYNRWGGTFGGPLFVPKVYDGRSKSFFMFAYEGLHQTSPLGTTATVPSAPQRNGDFSQLLNLGAIYQMYDPFTRQPAPGGRFSTQPLPGNVIPASRISPVAKNLMSYYPMPIVAGSADGSDNLPLEGWPERYKYHNLLYRFDHNLSEKNRAFLRLNSWHRVSEGNDWFGFGNPAMGAYFWQDQIGFVLDDVHIFSPTFVMNTRVSDSRFVRAQDSTSGRDFDIAKLGLPASLGDAIEPGFRRFPYVTINGYTGLGPRTILYRPVETRTLGATFTKIVGGHDLKFGGEYRQYVENQVAGTNATGTQLIFTEAYTRGPLDNSPVSPRGQGLASALFGVVAGGGLDKVDNYAELSTVWCGFLQDDWKVTRKLTVTLGLRYELEGPVTERFNRSVRGFDYGAQLPIEAQAKTNYARNPIPEVPVSQFSVRGGLTFAGVGGQPRTLWERDANNFMPRVGVAYSLTNKTVLRGGYGAYFGPLGTRRGDVIQTGFSRSTPIVASLDGGLTFKSTLANPLPDGILLPQGAAAGTMTYVGQGITFFNPKPLAARSDKWMFGIQRELPGRMTAEIRYFGSRGTDIEFDRPITALPTQYLSTKPTRDQAAIDYLSANLPNPLSGLLPGTSRTGALISRQALLTPYPQFTDITTSTNDGRSWYNSLNLEVQKRFSHGVSVQSSYTWSKYITATSLLNAGNATPERVISPQDYPHNLSLSWIYELPVGRGRPFLTRSHRAVDAVLGGWQISGIYTAQSGDALGFGDAILYGTLKDIVLPESQRKVERWFNTDVFERRPAQQLGGHLRIMPSRFNGIRSDGINYWDVSLLKNTNITEKVKFELRLEALNVLNHVTFERPNTAPNNTAFGTITAERTHPRRIQLTLRVKF